MNYQKKLLQYAYVWTPYAPIQIPPKVCRSLLDTLEFELLTNIKEDFVPCINKTGLLGPNSLLFYNATKFTRSNIYIMEKFLMHYGNVNVNNDGNERIRVIFKNSCSWQKDAMLARDRFHEVNIACDRIFNVFIKIE